MRFDLDQLGAAVAYNLLAGTVQPRPIAWVVSQSRSGVRNAAPFSFFNVMGSAPPTVALGLLADPSRGFKDTARNILETGEFVVNLVPERLVQAMNLTSADAPAEVDELDLAGLTTLPSAQVAPPRIADCPVAFECRILTSLVTGPSQTIVIGQVLTVHVADHLVANAERGHVRWEALGLIARGPGSVYYRLTDSFSLDRPTWAALQQGG